MKIIAVANNKGGVAKTTTAATLGYGLWKKMHDNGDDGRVLFIDLDPQGNLSDQFGVRDLAGERCVGDLLLGNKSFKQTVVPLDRSNDNIFRPNLFLLPASPMLESSTQELSMRTMIPKYRDAGMKLETILRDTLSSVMSYFSLVIIDCPPKLDVLKPAVYNFATDVVVPIKADSLSLRGAQQHTADMARMKQSNRALYQANLSAVVPTMVPARQVLASQVEATIRRVYGRLVSASIPESVFVKESPASSGRTLFEYAPDSAPAAAYWELVERFA